MADSVALLVVTNLATIGGHVAEMISIFVYPVIGYFWTRRRRRSLTVDMNLVEQGPMRSMIPVEETLDLLETLAKGITALISVLRTLEGLAPKVLESPRMIERFTRLMEEHRSLQERVLALMEEVSDAAKSPDDPIVLQGITRVSQNIRLLQLKGEMLSVEITQTEIMHSVLPNSTSSIVDVERGLVTEPVPCCKEQASFRNVLGISTQGMTRELGPTQGQSLPSLDDTSTSPKRNQEVDKAAGESSPPKLLKYSNKKQRNMRVAGLATSCD
ncbi:hypothetical protein VNI00_007066 [Paramarasmius palmivorus]|uniref:Uncharacterized protein n=1 Tax=Paramarasmius palmivorus TaxID=297713 RepID=A0AAW0BIT0_9AGAR